MSATSTSMSLAEQKRTATRQRIARAAAQLVISRGLAGATVDDIADTAEIGRATFSATSTPKKTPLRRA